MTKVKSEMTRKVAFVVETDDLSVAHREMKALNVRHVPVTRDGKVVGMLSDRDVLLHSKPNQKGEILVPNVTIKNVMSAPPLVCKCEDSVGAIAEIMIEEKIDAMPVVDKEDKLVGIITSTDLLRLLVDEVWSLHRPLPFHFEPHPLGNGAISQAWRP